MMQASDEKRCNVPRSFWLSLLLLCCLLAVVLLSVALKRARTSKTSLPSGSPNATSPAFPSVAPSAALSVSPSPAPSGSPNATVPPFPSASPSAALSVSPSPAPSGSSASSFPAPTAIARVVVDLEDRPNPSWEELKKTLVVGENSYGPALGSTIKVNRELIERGPYRGRSIPAGIKIHTPTHSYISRPYFSRQSRWYQEDGNTQIFRMFPGEDNVRNERINKPRVEAFLPEDRWQRGGGWYEWSGRYTFVKVREGAVFQLKHNETYWSMQLVLVEQEDRTFDLYYVKLRDRSAKKLLEQDVVGKSLNIRVFDNGDDQQVFVQGQLVVQETMSDRPDDARNMPRWGLYSPRSPMDRDILILVTGAYVGKWQ